MDGSDADCTRAPVAAAGAGANESSSLADTSLKPSLRRDGGVGGVGCAGGCRGRGGRDSRSRDATPTPSPVPSHVRSLHDGVQDGVQDAGAATDASSMTTLAAATPVVHSQPPDGSRVTGAGDGEAIGAPGVAQPSVSPRVAAPHAIQLALLAVLLEMTLSVAVELEMVLAVELLDSALDCAARALGVDEFFGIGAEGAACAACVSALGVPFWAERVDGDGEELPAGCSRRLSKSCLREATNPRRELLASSDALEAFPFGGLVSVGLNPVVVVPVPEIAGC